MLFLVNSPQALYVNLCCLECISRINLSPANKMFFTIAFSLKFSNKIFDLVKLLRIDTFIPVNSLYNALAACCLINVKFLLPYTAHFDKGIVIMILVTTTIGFLLSAFFYTSSNIIKLFYI